MKRLSVVTILAAFALAAPIPAGADFGPALPGEFPVVMAFRPFTDKARRETTMAELAPIPIIHDNLEFITNVAARYPEKITILHANYASLRRDEAVAARAFPGHFLYWTGSELTRAITATATELFVAQPAGFRADTPKKIGTPDDLIIHERGPDGKPDWSRFEYATVTRVLPDRITVKRGQYGTRARPFPAGAICAAHAQKGADRYGSRSWTLNFSLQCPKDGAGRSAAEWTARYWQNIFTNTHLTGIEFDVGLWNHDLYGRPVDCNNDLVGDYGYIGGVNSFGIGGQNFLGQLRALLGPQPIIQADSWNLGRGIRMLDAINGIEMEGFPCYNKYDSFSESLSYLRYWTEALTTRPVFCYPFTKEATTVFGKARLPSGGKTDFRFRLGLASACIVGMPHAYAAMEGSTDGVENDGTFGVFVWDEYVGGDMKHWGWLGRPIESASRDLSGLKAVIPAPKWELAIADGYVGHLKTDDGTHRVTVDAIPEGKPPQPGGVSLRARLPVALEAGAEYTLAGEVRGGDRWDYLGQVFERVPRQAGVWFGQVRRFDVVADSTWRPCLISGVVKEKKNTALELSVDAQTGWTEFRNIRLVKGGAERWLRRFEHGAVLLNATQQPWRVTLPGYRRLRGTQCPEVNTGAVGPEFVVPPMDALFLAK